jgi:hypothetical protein
MDSTVSAIEDISVKRALYDASSVDFTFIFAVGFAFMFAPNRGCIVG